METKVQQQIADVEVENCGSIFLLDPQTDAGREWIEQHLPEDRMYFGNRVAVEHNCIANIVEGMQGDGLIVA